jgi:hypothetical protein
VNEATRHHLNKQLDNIPDGSTYGRHVLSDMTGNRIDFSKPLLGKHLDNIPNGTNRAAWDTIAQKTAAVDASGNLLLKNISGPTATTNAPSQSSTTYTVVPEMTSTLTFKGNKVFLSFSASIFIPTVVGAVSFAFFKDGVQLSQDFDVTYYTANGSGGPTVSVAFSFIDTPSAASHTYDVRWLIIANGCSLRGTARTFQIVELG